MQLLKLDGGAEIKRSENKTTNTNCQLIQLSSSLAWLRCRSSGRGTSKPKKWDIAFSSGGICFFFFFFFFCFFLEILENPRMIYNSLTILLDLLAQSRCCHFLFTEINFNLILRFRFKGSLSLDQKWYRPTTFLLIVRAVSATHLESSHADTQKHWWCMYSSID